MHDWTKAEPETFHSFHLIWIASIANTLNRGLLPPGYFALGEKLMGPWVPLENWAKNFDFEVALHAPD